MKTLKLIFQPWMNLIAIYNDKIVRALNNEANGKLGPSDFEIIVKLDSLLRHLHTGFL
jgi:hypothetical protein